MYTPGKPLAGRASAQSLYLHQIVQALDLNESTRTLTGIALIGFASDEGVKRNQGRPGAVNGPKEIMDAFSNLSVHWNPEDFTIYNAGAVSCNGDLENASIEFEKRILQLLKMGLFPIALGGGHEISYPHMAAARLHANERFGVVNLDAHFDLREYENGAHSGSWARQIHDDDPKKFNYLPIGINRAVNHAGMFKLMENASQDLITVDEFSDGLNEEILNRIDLYLSKVDRIGLTLDLDVMSAAFTPGVSALATFGLTPEVTWQLIEHFISSGKMISMDIAELNPKYDDGRTAKLAAQMIWRVIDHLVSSR